MQKNGMMTFSLDKKDSEAGMTLILDNGYLFDSQIYAEVSLMIDKSSYGAQFGMEVNISNGWVACNIKAESTDQICCHTFLSTTSGVIPRSQTCQQITPGTWHKIRVDISETIPNTIDFYIDDKNVGQFIPDSDWHITENKLDGIKFALITHSEKPGLAYLDDFSLGPVK